LSKYNTELERAMVELSKKEDTIFLGQSMIYGGIAIANSFSEIPITKKIEMPVAENLQLGISTGLALTGYVPVSIFPRWNFLLLAADQLVNHLDKLSAMTDNKYNPKVIIRVAVGVKVPVDPQEQHVGDFTEGFSCMLKNVDLIKLSDPDQIVDAYLHAYDSDKSTILVEEHQF
jgi:pyruvate/2-oxoglutarate/acetoin dehydrogenase E1 component